MHRENIVVDASAGASIDGRCHSTLRTTNLAAFSPSTRVSAVQDGTKDDPAVAGGLTDSARTGGGVFTKPVHNGSDFGYNNRGI